MMPTLDTGHPDRSRAGMGAPRERRPRWVLGLQALLLSMLSALAPADRALAGELPLVVSVSVPPQAYFVERIGGDSVEVHVMVPPGSSPATYEPSPQQLVALTKSSLYVAVGHPAFLFELRHLKSLVAANPGIAIVDMAMGAEVSCTDGQGRELDDDPHIWLSPRLMLAAADRIAAKLSEKDPEKAGFYRQNLQSLASDIRSLDREMRELMQELRGRTFMVFHPAWSYFACDYGLIQMAIEAGGKEPGPAQLVATIEEARRKGIRVVFVQRGFSDRSARVIATELGARLEELDPLAHDWLENLRRSGGRIAEAIR